MALNRLALDAGLFRGLSAVGIDALMREIGAGMRGHATEFSPLPELNWNSESKPSEFR